MVATLAGLAAVAVALSVVARAPDEPRPGSPVPPLLAASSGPASPPTSPSPGLGVQTGRPSPSATRSLPTPASGIALVPIVGFWSTDRSLSSDRLRAALTGRDRRFRLVVVGDPDLAALESPLGVQASPKVRELAPAAVLDAVRGRQDVLGFIRATEIRPSVRALGVDGRTLFGSARVRSIAGWPLVIPELTGAGSPPGTPAFDPAATWTFVAAGDVMLDREVYRRTVLLARGADFPWNGGTAKIVGRACCSAGLTYVRALRTGSAGAVAALFRNADLALVNHEGPAPDLFTYHPTGLTFTFDPRLEVGLRRAGIDVVSLANNHIRNAGSDGVVQTIRAIQAVGIVPVGAGANLEAAREPAWFTVGGVRVAILAYDAIDLAAAGATSGRPGAAPLDLPRCRADIVAARAAGADVVIVVAHWGVEYTSHPTALQRRQAAALIGDGADIVLGSHPHWAGAIEAIGDGLVVYSMGDFIFDLPRSEQTDEGLIVELTFVGRHVAQVDIHPTIELDRSQPNLLDPAGDGRVVLQRVREASRPFLDW
jgi:poly-gamma-glutamate capsule biosynthesis protein CapA/YwtB (metallophosphatase superfamily)